MKPFLNQNLLCSIIFLSLCSGFKNAEIKSLYFPQTFELVGLKESQEYDLKDFNSINIGKGFKVEISKSDEYKVLIVGAQKDIDRYKPFVQNNTLHLKYIGREEDYKSTVDLKIIVHLPNLTGVNLNGRTESLITGFSSLDSLDIVVSGGSVATIIGAAKNVWVQVSGKSKLLANGLTTSRSVVSISDHSYCELSVSNSLFGNISSGAKLIYKGNAVQQVALSDGNIIHKDR